MLKGRVVIVYHGTSLVNSRRIFKEGFKKGTYFAKHLEDAIGYGGLYVFDVAYPAHLISKQSWQYIAGEAVLPEFIIQLTKYNRSRVVFDNMVLRHMVCISNATKAETKYITDDMKVNPSGYSEAELIAYGVKKGGNDDRKRNI